MNNYTERASFPFLRNWKETVPVLACGLLVLWVFAWFVTHGTGEFLTQEIFGTFFDAQAESFFRKRFDVPYEAIAGESFVRNGKYYGYFGPVPALIRIPVLLADPQLYGRLSHIMMMAGCVMSLLFVALTFKTVLAIVDENGRRRAGWGWRFAPYLLLAGLGSTNIFLASRSFIHHEATLLAAGFALGANYYLLKFLLSARARMLYACLLFSALAFFTRTPMGLGPMLVCLLLCALELLRVVQERAPRFANFAQHLPFPSTPLSLRNVFVIVGVAAVSVAAHLGISYLKFGEFSSVPYRLHEQYSPERLARADGRLASLSNVRMNVFNYFSPTQIRLEKEFPYVYTKQPRIFKEAKVDHVEPSASITAGMSAITVLSLAGLLVACRRWRDRRVRLFSWPIVSGILSFCPALLFTSTSHRYIHDSFPLLIFLSIVGYVWATARFKNALFRYFLATLIFANVFANVALAYTYERDIIWGIADDRKAEMKAFSRAVDSLVEVVLHGRGQIPIISSSINEKPAYPYPGQMWRITPTDLLYWFDGLRWHKIVGEMDGTSDQGGSRMFSMLVQYPDKPASKEEPVLITGEKGAANVVSVEYMSPKSLRFKVYVWGRPAINGRTLEFDQGRFYKLSIMFDNVIGAIIIKQSGETVFNEPTTFYRVNAADKIYFGTNLIAAQPMSRDFSGIITAQ